MSPLSLVVSADLFHNCPQLFSVETYEHFQVSLCLLQNIAASVIPPAKPWNSITRRGVPRGKKKRGKKKLATATLKVKQRSPWGKQSDKQPYTHLTMLLLTTTVQLANSFTRQKNGLGSLLGFHAANGAGLLSQQPYFSGAA